MYHLVRSMKNPVSCRYLSTTNSTRNANREAKFMMKLLAKSHIESKLSLNEKQVSKIKLPAGQSGYTMSNVIGTMNVTRRMRVLNTIYMKRISELLGTGTVNPALIERGIEISDVQINYDLNLIKIIWNSRQEDLEYVAETASLLNEAAPTLRHHLAEQRITSNVPNIQFVQDKQAACLREVERRLRIADFGEPTEIVPSIALDQNITEPAPIFKCKELGTIDELETEDIPLPCMKNNVFGLNQNGIMMKIKASIRKSKQATECSMHHQLSEVTRNNVTPPNLAEIMSQKEENLLFRKFLVKQQKEEKLKRKNLKRLQELSSYMDNDDDKNYEDYSEDNDDDNDDNDDDDEYYDDDSDSYEEDEYEDDDRHYYEPLILENKLQVNSDKEIKTA